MIPLLKLFRDSSAIIESHKVTSSINWQLDARCHNELLQQDDERLRDCCDETDAVQCTVYGILYSTIRTVISGILLGSHTVADLFLKGAVSSTSYGSDDD